MPAVLGLLPAGVLHGAEAAPHRRMPNKSVPGERLWRALLLRVSSRNCNLGSAEAFILMRKEAEYLLAIWLYSTRHEGE